MLEAIARIRTHTAGLDRAAFQLDAKTVDAVLFNLGLLGEAVASIPEPIRNLAPELPWTSMRGMRNVIVLEYSVSISM